MLCQKCGLTEATVHRKTTVFRVEIQEHLCQMCAGVGSALEPAAESGLGHVGPRRGRGIAVSATASGPRAVPDRFPRHGLREVAPYVARFLATTGPYASLHVCSPGQDRGFQLYSMNGEIVIFILIVPRPDNRELELRVRKFFSALKIVPESDRPGADGIRILVYPLSDETSALSALCVRLLSEAFLVTEEEGLDITYNERSSR